MVTDSPCAFNRGVQRVPGEAGAFDAGGKFAHAGEDFQAAQMVLFGFGVEVACDHPVKFVEHHFGFFLGLAFDGLVIIEAEAFEIAQPDRKPTSLTKSSSSFR